MKKILLSCLIITFLAIATFAAEDYVINPETGNIDVIGQSASDLTENDARYLNLDGESVDITNGTFNLTTTGVGTLDKLSLTNAAVSWDDITTANGEFTIQITEATDATPIIASAIGQALDFYLYSDGTGGLWGNHMTFSVPMAGSGATHSMRATGTLNLYTSNATGTAPNVLDYIQFRTVSDVPEITTVGSCNLKLTASSGLIDFDDDNIQTIGKASIGTTTLDEAFTVEGASGAYRTGLKIDTDASTFGPTLVGYTTRDGNNRLFFTGSFTAADDQPIIFGSGSDYRMKYDTGDTRFEFFSTDIDGIGTNGIVFFVNDGTDDVIFNGNLGVGTAVGIDSLLEINGAQGLAIETVTGNTTLDNTHSTLLANASGNITVTLPTSASSYNNTDGIGRIYEIKKIDADADMVTVDGNGSETIDGATTAVLTVQYESITIQADGSNWHII